MTAPAQVTQSFNTDAQKPAQTIYADSQVEFEYLTGTVQKINESTGGNTVVKLRQPEFRCGIH